MPDIITECVLFSGRVQGVGFRYTTRTIAKRHPVKGYVKNRIDGTVELVIQGTPETLNFLLLEVTDYFRDNIAHCERRAMTTDEVFAHFEIRF